MAVAVGRELGAPFDGATGTAGVAFTDGAVGIFGAVFAGAVAFTVAFTSRQT